MDTTMKRLVRKILIVFIFILSYALVFNNFFLMSKDLIYGDKSGEKILPKPFLGFFRIYQRENTIKHNAVYRLAGDYAQIYFPSQDFSSLSKNYDTGYLDPWLRPSRYAPFIHFLCSVSFCKLDYGYASFLHMVIQMLLFYFFFVVAFKMLNIESEVWFGLLLVNVFLFATPAGLSWFERGQFSLYVALSSLLLILGFMKNKPIFVFLSSLFAYVKWTSFPFLFVAFALFILSARNKKEFVHNILLGLMYLLPLMLLSLSFRSRLIHFLQGIYLQERFVPPEGISLSQILPEIFVKGLPFLLIFLGFLYLRKENKSFNDLIPYLTGAGILLLTYPTIAFEYSIPCLFCFIPLVFYWTKQPNIMNKIVRYFFILFLFLASWPDHLLEFVDRNGIVVGYLVVSIVFLLLPMMHAGEFLIPPRLGDMKVESQL
jgi:hypothetical protein